MLIVIIQATGKWGNASETALISEISTCCIRVISNIISLHPENTGLFVVYFTSKRGAFHLEVVVFGSRGIALLT